jgi:GTP cyclohydrolase I
LKKVLSIADVENRLLEAWPPSMAKAPRMVYGVPRGGWNIAMLLAKLGLAVATDHPDSADWIVDDIIDSGHTRDKWQERYPGKSFWAPYDKTKHIDLPWIVFPWEGSAEQDGQELVTRMLQMIGEDPTRNGLKDTPERVVRSWHELYKGYGMDPKEVLGTVFDSENKNMVLSRNIEFSSMCEHHMLPFLGHVTIGYIPNGKVVGLSKLARLVDVYAKRLQIQEGLTDQIAQAMTKHIPGIAGAAVVVTAKHQCMSCRGVGKQDSDMVTSALTGKFLEPVVRMEFMSLLRPFK